MSDFSSNQTQVPPQVIEKPMAVTVFGVLNCVLGCYFLVRMIYGWSGMIARVVKEPTKITESQILVWLIVVFSFGLVIWLIVLGIGLLTMKRWARRGSVLYGWIQIVLIVIVLGATVFSFVIGQPSYPALDINNALALIHWIYMILLLIFMQTAKVKRAFTAIEG